MQIRFPRRVRLGFRPWYGLTVRQMLYLLTSGLAAGLIVLLGPTTGSGLLIRALIGLGVISVGVALAFFRSGGLSIEQWLGAQIRYWTRPHQRVWTRGGGRSARGEVEHKPQPVPQRGPSPVIRPISRPAPVAVAAPRVPQAAIVLLDMAMLLALLTLTVYMTRGGLTDLHMWLATFSAR